MRGIVVMTMAKMGGILKAVWSALASAWKKLLSFIIVNGIVLMTRIAHSFKSLYAWTLLNIKQKLVPQIIQEEYKRVELMFVNKQLGQIGKLLLITVPLTLTLASVHLQLGLLVFSFSNN